MPLTQEMRRLRAEHAALVTLSGFMIEFVAARRPPRPTELAAVRGMFRDTLVRHLKCEDWALYPRLQTKGEPVLAELAARFVDEMGHIAEAFEAYDSYWTQLRVEADWPGFCAETRAILTALGDWIAREESELYPVAETLFKAEAPPPRERGRRTA